MGHRPLPARLPQAGRATLAYIDATQRVHARIEDGIRTGKDTGLGKFPSHAFALNQAWLAAALIAAPPAGLAAAAGPRRPAGQGRAQDAEPTDPARQRAGWPAADGGAA